MLIFQTKSMGIFFLTSAQKTYVVGTHQKCLSEAHMMTTHNNNNSSSVITDNDQS